MNWGLHEVQSRAHCGGRLKIEGIAKKYPAFYSYCLKNGYGTRVIPPGAITGAHFVKVQSAKVSYVQVTGVGDVSAL